MKEIVINSSECKRNIILVENGKLIEQYTEDENVKRLEGNIYLGKVTDVLPGMQAAFIDIGDEKNAFLHIQDLLPKVSNETGNKNEDFNKYNIKDYVRVGMPIIVEVKKDKTDKKGAKVSTNLNLAGKFIALIPNSEFVTISQKIEDDEKAKQLKEFVKNLKIENYGIILRTSSINATEKQIKEDIDEVINIHKNIVKQAEQLEKNEEKIPALLYDKGNLIDKILLDLGSQDIEKIITNDKKIVKNIEKIKQERNINVKVDLIEKNEILDIYNLNTQLEKVLSRKIWLNCGGFIIIDKTEALTAIDVNTGKFTGKENIEKTVLKVNLEATEEIAKQLRARDIGGIIVIDYIDMDSKKDEEEVKNLLEKCLKKDRAKTQVIGFTKLHLLEMTRTLLFQNNVSNIFWSETC